MSKKGVLLEYDVFIPLRNLLIEYNGRQHYEFTKIFHKNKDRFEQQKRRDRRKARLAKVNGYKLVVIKYTEPLFEDYIINKIERCSNDNKK